MGQSLLNVLHVNPVACSIIPTCDESALSPVLGAPCERKPRDSGFTPRHWPQPMVKRGSTALLRILSHTCARAASNTTVQCSSSLKVCPKRFGKRIEIGIRPITCAPNIHASAVRRWFRITATCSAAEITIWESRPVLSTLSSWHLANLSAAIFRSLHDPNFWWIVAAHFKLLRQVIPRFPILSCQQHTSGCLGDSSAVEILEFLS